MVAIDTNQLFSEIELLPVDMKTKLIDKLLSSLNPIKTDTETLWKREIDSRVNAIENGDVSLVDAETVFQKIKDKYQ
jgi:putative addiction module component (TIGR02574 family)